MMQLPLFHPNSPVRHLWNGFRAAAALFGLGVLSACVAPAAPPQSGVRLLIEFREPVDGAGPDLLARLASQSGASIRHISSASSQLHAYELTCTASDPDCAKAIESLQGAADIASVAPDSLRRHHTSPQP